MDLKIKQRNYKVIQPNKWNKTQVKLNDTQLNSKEFLKLIKEGSSKNNQFESKKRDNATNQ